MYIYSGSILSGPRRIVNLVHLEWPLTTQRSEYQLKKRIVSYLGGNNHLLGASCWWLCVCVSWICNNWTSVWIWRRSEGESGRDLEVARERKSEAVGVEKTEQRMTANDHKRTLMFVPRFNNQRIICRNDDLWSNFETRLERGWIRSTLFPPFCVQNAHVFPSWRLLCVCGATRERIEVARFFYDH